MNPTPEQLTRAAELAPCVAEIVGIRAYRDEAGDVLLTLGGASLVDPPEFVGLLDPRAFQAIVLALPRYLSERVKLRAEAVYIDEVWARGDDWLPFHAWLLTPAGMLAFYEALVNE